MKAILMDNVSPYLAPRVFWATIDFLQGWTRLGHCASQALHLLQASRLFFEPLLLHSVDAFALLSRSIRYPFPESVTESEVS